MVELSSWRRMSEIVWTVNCKDPSPVTRTPRLIVPSSLPATKDPRAAPVAYPMEPNIVWLYMRTPSTLVKLDAGIP
jgi:hypothetical protein